jgi:aldose sugar dehydrogenase
MNYIGPMKPVARLALAGAALLAVDAGSALADSEVLETDKVRVEAEAIAGLEHPWGLDFLPGGDAIVTERAGRIRILSAGKLSKPVKGVPKVAARGQGGLMDIAASPDFASSQLIFFSFSEPGKGGSGTAVARAKLVRDGASARLDDLKIIFSMARKTRTSHHFGSRLVFHPDGTLFITTGERGSGKRAQDFMDHAGSVIRVNPDGSVPSDNPFADGAKALPEIWSKGHRNVQGAVFDPVVDALITIEHGAKGGDELNRPEPGKNYGWPVISFGVNYSGTKIGKGTEAPGYEQPLYYWDPSIAPSGLVSYDGDMFPEWRGDLIAGALKFQLVSRLDRDASGKVIGEERMFEDAFGRIRDINVAPDGSLWLLTDESDGAIVRISRAD